MSFCTGNKMTDADKTNLVITSVFYRYESHSCISKISSDIAQLFKHLKPGDGNTATTEEITAELKINGRFKILSKLQFLNIFFKALK